MYRGSGTALQILATSVVNEIANICYFVVRIKFKAHIYYKRVTANE